MQELDFTLEMDAEGVNDVTEADMFREADTRLRDLAGDHNDMTGAAINVRQPAHGETSYLYEVTIAVYVRPEQMAATEKHADPLTALKNALDAVERQVRQKRDRLRETWKQPGNEPLEEKAGDLWEVGDTDLADTMDV
jgi:ribosome-associated translation inhibitor RaiA